MNDTDILHEILYTLRQIRDRLPEAGQQPCLQKKQPETAGRNPNHPARLQVLAILDKHQQNALFLPAEPDVQGSSPNRSV